MFFELNKIVPIFKQLLLRSKLSEHISIMYRTDEVSLANLNNVDDSGVTISLCINGKCVQTLPLWVTTWSKLIICPSNNYLSYVVMTKWPAGRHHQTSPLEISDFHRTVKTTYFSGAAFSLLSLG